MKIYLDFDGTVVEHEYPKIGRCNFGCFEIIKKLQDAGHEIILNTMRVEFNDGSKDQALRYLSMGHLMVLDRSQRSTWKLTYEITRCTYKKLHPDRWDLPSAIKSGVMYIDDIAPDIPLKNCSFIQGKMVDWTELDRQFIEHNIY
jgi:hypothetical protein